jgi:hypothetical protein
LTAFWSGNQLALSDNFAQKAYTVGEDWMVIPGMSMTPMEMSERTLTALQTGLHERARNHTLRTRPEPR